MSEPTTLAPPSVQARGLDDAEASLKGFVYLQEYVGKALQHDDFSATIRNEPSVGTRNDVAMNLDQIVDEVHDPIFAHAAFGVELRFNASIFRPPRRLRPVRCDQVRLEHANSSSC